MESVKKAKFFQSEISFHNYENNTYFWQKKCNICKKKNGKKVILSLNCPKQNRCLCFIVYFQSFVFHREGKKLLQKLSRMKVFLNQAF